MKILTEYKNKKDTKVMAADMIQNWMTIKNFEPGEAVGIYLKQLKPSTINLIHDLLYFKHPVTLKYNDKQYKLYCIEDWSHTYQDPEDQLRKKTDRHPILQDYLAQQKEERFYKEKRKRTQTMNLLYLDCPELKDTTEEEMDLIIHNYAPLFQMRVDYDDPIEKIQAYIQLKFYIDNEFKPDIIPADEEMIITFGNELYFEDLIYKRMSEEEILRLSCIGTRVIK